MNLALLQVPLLESYQNPQIHINASHNPELRGAFSSKSMRTGAARYAPCSARSSASATRRRGSTALTRGLPVVEVDDFSEVEFPGGKVVAPFLGEHADLDIRAKTTNLGTTSDGQGNATERRIEAC
jgi:hypothetical protein